MASVAVATAVSNPNVATVPPTSLSIVLGTPTTGSPFFHKARTMPSVPSPPIATRARHRRPWREQFSPLLRKRARCLANQPQHFTGFGVAHRRLFGEYVAPVDVHLEDAARRLDQPHFSMRKRIADLGRQTGGPRLVVSDDAVFDCDGHGVNDSRA